MGESVFADRVEEQAGVQKHTSWSKTFGTAGECDK